jgi:hypothetical protein
MSSSGGVIHIGSFSKSVAPALRVGCAVAPWPLLALKTDAGSAALDQMALAAFCATHVHSHVVQLNKGLRRKLVNLMEALSEYFGTAAEFEDPKGGIFLWVKLPTTVDAHKLAQVALASGVATNPGPEWSTDPAFGRTRLRICFANSTEENCVTASPNSRKSAAVSLASLPVSPTSRQRYPAATVSLRGAITTHPNVEGGERLQTSPCHGGRHVSREAKARRSPVEWEGQDLYADICGEAAAAFSLTRPPLCSAP